MVVHALPSPRQAQLVRAPSILHGAKPDFSTVGEKVFKAVSTNPETAAVEEAIAHCRSDDAAPLAVFVAKMVAVAPESFPTNRRIQLTAEELRARRQKAKEAAAATAASGATESPVAAPSTVEVATDAISIEVAKAAAAQPAKRETDVFMGFARVFSGVLRPGQEVYVLLPRYNPADPTQHFHKVTIDKIYLMMGRDLEELDEVPPGNLVSIEGLAETVLKSATISSTLSCPPFGKVHGAQAPIVRVALEPTNPLKMPQLVEGLKLLNQADPSVEIIQQSTGEHILITAGELHLERCMKDLRERFAKISIEQSPPIVPFRETVTPVNGNDKNTATIATANKKLHMTVQAVPLPESLRVLLEKSAEQIKALQARPHDKEAATVFYDSLNDAFAEAGPEWKARFNLLWSFGPRRVGSNILINAIPGYGTDSSWVSPVSPEWTGKAPAFRDQDGADSSDAIANAALEDDTRSQAASDDHSVSSSAGFFRTGGYHGEYDSAIINGFQLATMAGPLCDEPITGVCFIVEGIRKDDNDQEETRSFGPITGQIISATKEACRQAFLGSSPRLVLAVYSCNIQATSDVLGKVYAVLSRRRGKILSEVMKEGTSIFNIRATLPVVESFGFADEIRSKTSGLASPQLVFSGWETFELDPFWVPTTEEELEDLGEKSDRENVARRYMLAVRRRKGLAVDDKIVENAEKQRTLKK